MFYLFLLTCYLPVSLSIKCSEIISLSSCQQVDDCAWCQMNNYCFNVCDEQVINYCQNRIYTFGHQCKQSQIYTGILTVFAILSICFLVLGAIVSSWCLFCMYCRNLVRREYCNYCIFHGYCGNCLDHQEYETLDNNF